MKNLEGILEQAQAVLTHGGAYAHILERSIITLNAYLDQEKRGGAIADIEGRVRETERILAGGSGTAEALMKIITDCFNILAKEGKIQNTQSQALKAKDVNTFLDELEGDLSKVRRKGEN